MSQQTQTRQSPLVLNLEAPTHYKTSIRNKQLELACKLIIKNLGFEFEQLSIVVDFDAFNFKSQEFEIDKNQFEDGSASIEIFPIERSNGEAFTISVEQLLQIKVTIKLNDKEVLTDQHVVTLLPPVKLSVDIASVYSIVFQQNQFPLISQLELTNFSPEPLGLVKVIAEFDPPKFAPVTWNIDDLAPGQSTSLQERHLRLSANTLNELNEKHLIQVKFSVFTNDLTIAEVSKEIELLPKNHWGGEKHMPELLAAFVTPNSNYCEVLLKKASNLLAKDGYESQLDGYQSNTRERPYMIAAALWSVISSEGISYCVPPASFTKKGQKIRLSSDISNAFLATCLDTALLFASCLEQAGLNSVIALTKEHAMVGLWLIDESFPLLTNDDPTDLRNRIALKDLILFETTLVTGHHPIKFSQAIDKANSKISEPFEHEFDYVLDIKQARSRKISPIDFGRDDTAHKTEHNDKKEVALPTPPVFPLTNFRNSTDKDLSPSDRVDQWRRKLLDLSKRNKLLNISRRSMGFRILSPNLDLLEDELATGKKFKIISKDKVSSNGRSSEQFTLQTGENLEDEFIRDQLKRGTLVAGCNERDLEKNLINLFRRAKSDLEEGGSNTLFLAMGMLRWKESPLSEQSYKAPLILLPVRLERSSARTKPKIMQIPEEGPVFNLTLIEFLFQDFEIDLSIFQNELPKDHSGVDVKGIWNIVREKIKDTPGFEVVEELVLSNFSFAKYLMWKDLSDRIDDLKRAPFVNHLVEKPTEPYPYDATFIEEKEVDEKISPENFFAPLNADSSQMAAIEASAKNVDFVLEGPPGTGKSETIANIISHNMALGQKVLFVSEKMAALEVVYARLKKVGLGHLCLELHSNKASRKSVVDQLNQAWTKREKKSQNDWEQKALQLGQLRKQLNLYVERLHQESKWGYSVWGAFSQTAGKESTTRVELAWPPDLATAPLQTKLEVDNARTIAKNLGLAFKDMTGVDIESFSIITTSNWTPVWQTKVVQTANDLSKKLDEFDRQFIAFTHALGEKKPEDVSQKSAAQWVEVAQACMETANQSYRFALVENSKELLGNLDRLAELKGNYDTLISTLRLGIPPESLCVLPIEEWNHRVTGKASIQEQYHAEKSVLSEIEAWGFSVTLSKDKQADIEQLLHQCDCALPNDTVVALPVSDWIQMRDAAAEKNPFTRFFSKHKITRSMRQAELKKNKDLGVLDVYARLVDAIVQAQHHTLIQRIAQAKKLRDLATTITKMFVDYSDNEILCQWDTTSEEIIRKKEHGVSIRKSFMAAASQLTEPKTWMSSVRKKLIDEQEFLEDSLLLEYAKKLIQCHKKLTLSLHAFQMLTGETDLPDITFSELRTTLNKISASAEQLNAWCHWTNAKNEATHKGLNALAQALENGLINWDEAEEQFESAFCIWLAPLLIEASDVLCQFSASKHEDLIERFRNLDQEVAHTTGQFIAAKLAHEPPDTTRNDTQNGHGTLTQELQKKRGQKSVRQLIQESGRYLLNLMPCFMMSPLSVAQYLSSDFQAFDLVIFDEASQITVWDAVGAIARGKNVIVVGDPKQMPPTNFFNRAQDIEDSDAADLESILDQAMGANLTRHRLKGHYRSRHESLITFSNQQYYQNELITYPCADTRESAVIWHRVDGVYSKGAARNNPIEARAVVHEVIRRLKDPELQQLSIGIVTLNSEQQRLIEDLLDDARRKDTSLERFFREDSEEPVFVKNLETVQGDQRDIIFLSVGYGPTEQLAKTMSMNFGPLNRQGGERRLNVAITRASTEMHLFTSFDASMIDLSRTSAEAIKDLKAYIDYAARGPIALAQRADFDPHQDQFDSEFEHAVATKLRNKGWQIRTQVGVSKFRIDLAVLDPDLGGSFLAGIECDGATYHSLPSARDRDRIRHIILENLGWKLIRIWSTDYFIHPDRVIEKVHQQLEEFLQQNRNERLRLANQQTEGIQTEQEPIGSSTSENHLNKNPVDTSDTKDAAYTPTEHTHNNNETTRTPPVSAPQSSSSLIDTYACFSGKIMPDPRESTIQTVAEGLLEIIRLEGPILAKRAFDVYLRHCGIKRMGKELRVQMNHALQHTIDKGSVVKQDEYGSGEPLDAILRLPEQPTTHLREIGDRTIDEVPPSEIREAATFALLRSNVDSGSEEHLREILNLFGLKRLTKHTHTKLLQALMGHEKSQAALSTDLPVPTE